MNAATEIDLIAPRGSTDRVASVLEYIWQNYTYARDDETYNKVDYWAGALRQFGLTGKLVDDCDGFGRFVIAMMFFLAGLPLRDMAEVLTDANRIDQAPLDHHIAALRIEGKWFYAHCWAKELLTEHEIKCGGYATINGDRASGMDFIKHRAIDTGNFNWRTGTASAPASE